MSKQEQEKNLVEFMRFMAEVSGRMGMKQEGWAFQSVEGFYLAKGALFPSEPLTSDEEKLLLSILSGHGLFKTKECYGNAARLVVPSGGRPGPLVYCEGYASGRAIIPVQHAWVSLNGKPVDVTWREDYKARNTSNPKRVLERIKSNIQGCSYYGMEVEAGMLVKHILKAKMYSPIVEGVGYDFAPVRTGTL